MSTNDTPAPPQNLSAPEPPLAVSTGTDPGTKRKVGPLYIWLQVVGQFGVFAAFMTPLVFSLSLRLSQLAPGHEEYLGYITGSGALVVMLTGPLLGVLSDRTRTRLGRRRPFMIAGTILGVISLFVMALAPNPLMLGFGWILAQLGWGQTFVNLQISMADKLPESQRGKVAGLTGFATQIAPVFGLAIAGSFAANPLAVFLVPGIIGVIAVLLFVLFIKEEDTRGRAFDEPLSLSTLATKYVFNPKQYPDFSWTWLGRFMFYFGLTLSTTFTTFFMASRLGVSVAEIAPLVAVLGGLGIMATTAGAVGGGFLSDKFHRRRAFVLTGSGIFGLGGLVMAFSTEVPLLFAGSVLTQLGIGMFSAVDQALILDVLPDKDQSAGRFWSIIQLAVSIPQAAAPFVAPALLAIGAGAGGEKNYTLLYVVAAVITLLGGLVVMRVKSVR